MVKRLAAALVVSVALLTPVVVGGSPDLAAAANVTGCTSQPTTPFESGTGLSLNSNESQDFQTTPISSSTTFVDKYDFVEGVPGTDWGNVDQQETNNSTDGEILNAGWSATDDDPTQTTQPNTDGFSFGDSIEPPAPPANEGFTDGIMEWCQLPVASPSYYNAFLENAVGLIGPDSGDSGWQEIDGFDSWRGTDCTPRIHPTYCYWNKASMIVHLWNGSSESQYSYGTADGSPPATTNEASPYLALNSEWTTEGQAFAIYWTSTFVKLYEESGTSGTWDLIAWDTNEVPSITLWPFIDLYPESTECNVSGSMYYKTCGGSLDIPWVSVFS